MRLRKIITSIALAVSMMANGAEGEKRITVEAQGKNYESAKRAAFDQAIEQTMGILLVSDLETDGKQITKDFIGSYSSGYINDYEVIEQYTIDGQIHVKMNVAVSSSKIANRMMVSGKTNQSIDGLRMDAIVETQLDQRQKGDAVLRDVLEAYPENAFIVNSGQTELRISKLRQPYLELNYSVVMSRFWVEALLETLNQIAMSSSSCNGLTRAVVKGVSASNTSRLSKTTFTDFCGTEPDIRVDHKSHNGWMSSSNSYYFADLNSLHLVNEQLQSAHGRNRFGLLVELTNASGETLDSGCFDIPSSYFVGFEKPKGKYNLNEKKTLQRPVIQAQQKIAGKLQIGIDEHVPLEDIAGIRMMVRQSCGNNI